MTPSQSTLKLAPRCRSEDRDLPGRTHVFALNGVAKVTQQDEVVREHRYRTEWPFPVSCALGHFISTPEGMLADRALRLLKSTESLIRYAAILAVADYATSPTADAEILRRIREKWIRSQGMSFGTWCNEGLMTVLSQCRESWSNPFIPEFGKLRAGKVDKLVQPVIRKRNQISHGTVVQDGEWSEILSLEKNLLALLETFDFLQDYPLCYAMREEGEEQLSSGDMQTIFLCQGQSDCFQGFLVTPSPPLKPCEPFVWNRTFNQVLVLSPFLVYGRAAMILTGNAPSTPDAKPVRLEGMLVMNKAKGTKENYHSHDRKGYFSVASFDFPEPGTIRNQLDHTLEADATHPSRREVQLPEAERNVLRLRPEEIPPGSVFEGAKGSYAVEGLPLGRGGMGVVYLGREESQHGGTVAIKTVSTDTFGLGSTERRIAQETAMLLELGRTTDCPYLLKGYDTGTAQIEATGKEYSFVVVDFADGGSLANEIRMRSDTEAALCFGEALDLVTQICHGVGVLHRHNVVHRDLKPGNILLRKSREDGEGKEEAHRLTAMVADYGLAQRMDQDMSRLPLEQGEMGTFDYMAPEQFGDFDAPIDRRADIYAIGKIWVEMLTGLVPRNAEEMLATDFERRIRSRTATSAGNAEQPSRQGRVPFEGLRLILSGCLARHPDDRIKSVDGLLQAIAKIDELDEACRRLEDSGISDPDVRSAFGLAESGHADARARLLRWCASSGDSRHEQAAIALTVLDGGEPIELIRQARKTRNLDSRDGLTHALARVLNWQERHCPHLWGQPWLRGLRDIGKRARRIHFRENLQAFRKAAFFRWAWYGMFAAAFGALGSLVTSPFEGNIYWGVLPVGSAFDKYAAFFLGHLIVGILAIGAFPLAARFGTLFERPKRYAAIFLAVWTPYAVGMSAAMLFFHNRITRCELAERCAVQGVDASSLVVHYLALLVALHLIGLTAYFCLKQLPAMVRRGPSFILSVILFPAFTAAFCLPSVCVFAAQPFSPIELWGELVIAYFTVLGVGVADYCLDLRELSAQSRNR